MDKQKIRAIVVGVLLGLLDGLYLLYYFVKKIFLLMLVLWFIVEYMPQLTWLGNLFWVSFIFFDVIGKDTIETVIKEISRGEECTRTRRKSR